MDRSGSEAEMAGVTGRHARLDATSDAEVADALREHWGRLVAVLVRDLGDLDLAEDSVAEAFARATRAWRGEVPDRPAAWLLTTARRCAVDRLRRRATLARRLPLLVRDLDPVPPPDPDVDAIPDVRLRLVATCCHPALSYDASVALALRLVVGLSTREVARLFLVGERTMQARITRAKRKIALAGIAYREPGVDELPALLGRVCSVAYLLFTEGYAATEGPDLIRPRLCEEAIALVRVLDEVVPEQPEVLGLLALMRLQHSRRDARVADGRLVPLPRQDRGRWRGREAAQGLRLIERSAALAPSPGPYTTQAAIAAEHVCAPTAASTDWGAISDLYAHLEAVTGSPVVRLNRAVAAAEAGGADAGLALLVGLEERLAGHHRLWAVRAELQRRAGRSRAALDAYARALDLVGGQVERRHLLERRDELAGLVGGFDF